MSRQPRLDGRDKLTPAQREEVRIAYEDYIDEEEDPSAAGFVAYDPTAILYKVNKDNIYDWPELHVLSKRALAKQEHYLLKKGIGGQGAAMAIFRLKQPNFGYRDKFEQDLTTGGEKLNFANIVPRPITPEEKKAANKKKNQQ